MKVLYLFQSNLAERMRAGRAADRAHRGKETTKPFRIGIGRCEDVDAVPGFVLVLAGSQGLREGSPESIEAGVGHFEHASDIGGLGAIEKHTGIEGIGIDAVFAFQELQRHEGQGNRGRSADAIRVYLAMLRDPTAPVPRH
jgi:hypothetical protein